MISICYDQETDYLSLKPHITNGHHGGDERQISQYESKLSSNKQVENPSFREWPHPMRFLSFATVMGSQFFRHMVLEFKLMAHVG